MASRPIAPKHKPLDDPSLTPRDLKRQVVYSTRGIPRSLDTCASSIRRIATEWRETVARNYLNHSERRAQRKHLSAWLINTVKFLDWLADEMASYEPRFFDPRLGRVRLVDAAEAARRKSWGDRMKAAAGYEQQQALPDDTDGTDEDEELFTTTEPASSSRSRDPRKPKKGNQKQSRQPIRKTRHQPATNKRKRKR